MTEFLRNNNDPKQWQQAADHLNKLLLESLRPLSEAGTVDDTPFKTAHASALVYRAEWPAARLVYTYAQLDTDGLISQALVKNIAWQRILNAKACFGPLEDLQKVYQCGLEKGAAFDLNEALGWSSRSVAFCAGLKSEACYATTEQLLKWGANPATNFYTAVTEGSTEIGKLYARYGLPAETIALSMKQTLAKGQLAQYRQFREIYWEYGRFTVVDPETLVEKKSFDANEYNQLKVVFNFAAGRVSEIYEWKDNIRQPVLRDFTMDEYGPAAIEKARSKLIEMGGNPSSERAPLRGKSSFPLRSNPPKTP